MSDIPAGMSEMKPDFSEALAELGTYRDRFESLHDNPTQLLDQLRTSPDFAVAVVRADTRPWLRLWLDEDPANEWQADLEGTGPLGAASVGVEWRYQGTHARDDVFNGLPATGQSVTVEGFSILRAGPDGLRVRRYVNWVLVFQQLGLSMNWRVPLTNPPNPNDPPPDPVNLA
jgi:hypothetical protein